MEFLLKIFYKYISSCVVNIDVFFNTGNISRSLEEVLDLEEKNLPKIFYRCKTYYRTFEYKTCGDFLDNDHLLQGLDTYLIQIFNTKKIF